MFLGTSHASYILQTYLVEPHTHQAPRRQQESYIFCIIGVNREVFCKSWGNKGHVPSQSSRIFQA